jgi:Niemann-Pick C1 protein
VSTAASTSLRPACQQVQQKLPWFLESVPSMACAKGGAGAYTDAIQVCTLEQGCMH